MNDSQTTPRRASAEARLPGPGGPPEFRIAAERWLAGPVSALRPATRSIYRNSVDTHLNPRFATHPLDSITTDEVALLVRDLREAGRAEWSIAGILGAFNRIYKFAARRLGWCGRNPAELLMSFERPRVSTQTPRPIFVGEQLAQTIAAAHTPYKALFLFAAMTGARVSEICGLRWSDIDLDDLDDASVEFSAQVDRRGKRTPPKTQSSSRTIPIPAELAQVMSRHRVECGSSRPQDPVFASRSRQPLRQRNISRVLRTVMTRAVDSNGRPTFPVLHMRDESGQAVPVPRATVPSMHSFRHTVASRALLAGESVDELAFLLGHKNGNVTRAVYVRELADGRRRQMRRSRMVAEFRKEIEAAGAEVDRDA